MTYEEVLTALTADRLCLVEDLDEKNLYQPAVYYQRDDRLWKAVLEDLIDDFLRFFFPESHKLFDLNRGVEYLDKERRRAVFNFLHHFVHFENEETRRDFEKDLQQLTNNNITMGTEEYLLDKARTEGIERGMERGIEKGLRQGKEQFVKYLIVQLGPNDKQIAAAAEVSIEFVRQVRRRITAGREWANSRL